MVELKDPEGLFQPKQFHDSVIASSNAFFFFFLNRLLNLQVIAFLENE